MLAVAGVVDAVEDAESEMFGGVDSGSRRLAQSTISIHNRITFDYIYDDEYAMCTLSHKFISSLTDSTACRNQRNGVESGTKLARDDHQEVCSAF